MASSQRRFLVNVRQYIIRYLKYADTGHQNHLCSVIFTLGEFIYNYVYNLDAQTGPNRPYLAFFSLYNQRGFYSRMPDIFTCQWGTPRSHRVHRSQKNCVSINIAQSREKLAVATSEHR